MANSQIPGTGRRPRDRRPAPWSRRAGRHVAPRADRRWRTGLSTVAALIVTLVAVGSYRLATTPRGTGTEPATTTSSPIAATTLTFANTPGYRVVIVPASEDGTVDSEHPDAIGGSNKVLWVDGDPLVLAYLKFRIDDVNERPSRTVLMLYATTGSPQGFSVHRVMDTSWNATTISYSNAPPLGVVLGSSGSYRSESIVQVELDPFITGSGDYAIALATSSSTRIGFGSLESSVSVPQLLIRTQETP